MGVLRNAISYGKVLILFGRTTFQPILRVACSPTGIVQSSGKAGYHLDLADRTIEAAAVPVRLSRPADRDPARVMVQTIGAHRDLPGVGLAVEYEPPTVSRVERATRISTGVGLRRNSKVVIPPVA
jgi:hypothetical protein